MKAIRYFIMTLLMAAMVFAFAACGNEEEPAAADASADAQSSLDADSSQQAQTPPADLELTGDWYDETSQRARMTITAGEGDNAYDVEIVWASSAAEGVVWTFSGTFDPAAGFLYYQDCRKALVTAEEDAVTGGETIEYEGGTGKLVYDSGALLWQDDKENAGADCHFIKPPEGE